MAQKNDIVELYRLIKEDYKYDEDVFSEDDALMRRLKKIVNTKLSVADKTIILLYADTMSYRKVGEMIGLSHATIRTQVQRIRQLIVEEL